jgi:hypothetical protein
VWYLISCAVQVLVVIVKCGIEASRSRSWERGKGESREGLSVQIQALRSAQVIRTRAASIPARVVLVRPQPPLSVPDELCGDSGCRGGTSSTRP